MYTVYILQSFKDKTCYIGYTSKLVEERLKEHNAGKNQYTKGHKPYKILKTEEVKTLKEAQEKEKNYKETKQTKRVIEMMGPPDSSRD